MMESEWIKADFKSVGQVQSSTDERLRLAQEILARDLSINLSAFLRDTIAVTYTGGGTAAFGDLLKDEGGSCCGSALLGPDHQKLLLRADYSVLFPLIGIALGAKAGSFASPGRKPTDIELQVVNLLFKLILSETHRAWSALLKAPSDSMSLEIEATPSRAFAATDLVFTANFDLTIAECTGKLSLLAPASVFTDALPEDAPEQQPTVAPSGSIENTVEQMMSANVCVDVWLDQSEIRLGDLLELREGQIVKLDHPVEQKVGCTLNGTAGFSGQIVSTGSRRAFVVEDFIG